MERLIKEDKNLNYKKGLIRTGKIKATLNKRAQKNNNNIYPNDKNINGVMGLNGDINSANKKDVSKEA